MSELFHLLEYLEDNDGYRNAHGVGLSAFDDGRVLICSIFPGSKKSAVVTLEIDGLFEEAFFMSLFKVTCVEDLAEITHNHLMRMYQGGLMDINCMVEEERLGGELLFRKTVQGLLVIDAEGNTPHLADRDLVTFEDFVSYTSVYFLLAQTFWAEQG